MMDFSSSKMKRPKKPKPLFGIFRSKSQKHQDVLPLGSGIGPVPLHSILSPTPKPSISDTRPQLFSPQFPPKQERRPRSRSVGPSARLLNEREMALNKLCLNDSNPQSLADSIALLSPPPVPPIPVKHKIRKFSSDHDLTKTAKANPPPVPPLPKISTSTQDISRSKSLNSYRLQSSKSLQQLKCPKTATATSFPRRIHDDDDDIPLGFLQSPISKPSSLLTDKEDDDDIDLIPIARLNRHEVKATHEEFMTAADKYKEKVKERLHLDNDDDDDDNLPISLSFLKRYNNKK